jgi:hypothetical protein
MDEENFYTQLTEEEKVIFNKYKSNEKSFCYNLNNNLRSNTLNNEQLTQTEILDGIILQYTHNDEIVLHRATIEELVLPFLNGNLYTNPEFLSTATDLESIESHFTNANNPVYIQFQCVPNTNMAPLQSNPQFGDLENEMLLGRNFDYEIIENRISIDRTEIENIMGRPYSQNVNSLRIIIVKSAN